MSRRPSPALPTRRRATRLATSMATGLALAAGLVAPTTASAGTASTYSAPLRTAVKSLPVAAESNSGYDRDRYFGDWRDTNGDCQNTRHEVLVQETKVAPTYSSRRCTVKAGKWVTSWDGRTHRYPTTVQIDHTVPVHEAWGSGAKGWTQTRRKAFYNDLGDKRSLNAQTSALNSSKGARGPEQWLPPTNRCRYVQEWTAVKLRWRLKVDATEKAALTRLAAGCSNVTVTVNRV
ncbi:HNH endonuclease family protein [Kytococcus sp. Marseille-QA3725]